MAAPAKSVDPRSSASMVLAAAPTHALACDADRELERVARIVFADIKAKITSSHDIISRFDYIDLRTHTMKPYYEKYGHRFLDFMDHQVKIGAVRELVEEAVSECTALLDPTASKIIAISKFGVGECDEVGTYGTVHCALHKVQVLGLILVDNVEKAELFAMTGLGSLEAHTFVLLGVSKTEIEELTKRYGNHFVTVLSNIKHGVLFDPFLSEIFLLRDFKKKSDNVIRYAKVQNTQLIWRTISEDASKCVQILFDAEVIFCKAREILLKTPSKITRFRFKGLAEQVRGFLSEDIITELKKNPLAQDLNWKWKKNLETGTAIWAEGTSDKIDSLSAHLQKLGVKLRTGKVKKPGVDEIHACILENLSLEQLRKMIVASAVDTASLATPASPTTLTLPASPASPVSIDEKEVVLI